MIPADRALYAEVKGEADRKFLAPTSIYSERPGLEADPEARLRDRREGHRAGEAAEAARQAGDPRGVLIDSSFTRRSE
jgi:hypothetical protein